MDKLRQDIIDLNLNTVVSNMITSKIDIDSVWKYWMNVIIKVVNVNVPHLKVKNSNSPPWVDTEVIHMSNKKKTARRKAKKLVQLVIWINLEQ